MHDYEAYELTIIIIVIVRKIICQSLFVLIKSYVAVSICQLSVMFQKPKTAGKFVSQRPAADKNFYSLVFLVSL